MERIVKAIITAVDRATPTIRVVNQNFDGMGQAATKAAAAADRAMSRIRQHVERTHAAIEKKRQGVKALGDRLEAIQKAGGYFRYLGQRALESGGAVGLLAQRVRVASLRMQMLGNAANNAFTVVRVGATAARSVIAGMMGPLGSVMRIADVLGAIGGGGLAAGLTAVAHTGVDMTEALRGATSTLTTMLGSAQSAQKFVAELNTEAANSLPTFKQLLPIATGLVQAYGPSGLGKVIPTIRAFGDATTMAAGGDTSRMELALLGFRQMLSRGVASQEELNQIGENLGISVTKMLVQAFGTADTEALQKAGVTGEQVADAIVAGLNRQFGGAQRRGATGSIGGILSGIGDAFNSFSAAVTGALHGSIMKSLTAFLDWFKGFEQSKAGVTLMRTLTVLFTGFGRVLEGVVKQVEPFTQWLAKIVTAENVVLFLTNVLALLQTVGQTVLQLFGVDLQKAMDPKNVLGWFDALGQATEGAINGGFGMARVFQEAGRMIRSAIQDAGDHVRDFGKDAEYVFKSMLLNVESSIHNITASMLEAVQSILENLRKIIWVMPWGQAIQPFGFIDTTTISEAKIGAQNSRDKAGNEAGGLLKNYNQDQKFRQQRDAERLKEDPFRKQDPGTRLYEAFMGIGRDRSAQDAFWKRFEQNRSNFKGLFAGAAPTPQVPGLPGGPLLYRQSKGPSSVTSYTLGPQAPGTGNTGAFPKMPGLKLADMEAAVGMLQARLERLQANGAPKGQIEATQRSLHQYLQALYARQDQGKFDIETPAERFERLGSMENTFANIQSLEHENPNLRQKPGNGDPFTPVTLPNGQVVSAFHAQQMGLFGSGSNGGASVTQREVTGANGQKQMEVTIVVNTWEQLKSQVLGLIDAEKQKAYPGVTY